MALYSMVAPICLVATISRAVAVAEALHSDVLVAACNEILRDVLRYGLSERRREAIFGNGAPLKIVLPWRHGPRGVRQGVYLCRQPSPFYHQRHRGQGDFCEAGQLTRRAKRQGPWQHVKWPVRLVAEIMYLMGT
jgi:hypothetical protein